MHKSIVTSSKAVQEADGTLVVRANFSYDDSGVDQEYPVTYLNENGFVERNAYVRVFRQAGELKIIISGIIDIDQDHFTVGLVQTPFQFELDETTSRKLFTQEGSGTAAGTIVATPGLYYNDITYLSTFAAFLLKRVSNNGNIYTIQFTNCQLTAESEFTDLNWRVNLEL